MGNYDFTGLSTRSFEKLAQALAVRILGPGTIVFGDGPDGGREATHDGLVNYPSAAKQWNGYIVLQAKFRQRLTDKSTDSDWAVGQLREELKKFAERKSGRRVPDYYIFITNAVLSPVEKTGGKDRAATTFEEFAEEAPLRDWAIWDYDQLSTYLDIEEPIRKAYAAFITPGDVLAEVMKWLQPARQDFGEVMTDYLAKELNAAKYANLEQTSASRILLSRVFVDLPIAAQRLTDPPDESSNPLDGFVATLIDAAADRLDPETTRQSLEKETRARYVFVGGPGQGKTTVGQFACQLFRAAILQDRPPHLLAPEIHDALDETRKVCLQEQLELPKARRFPLHVVLSEFATAVSKRTTAIAGGQPIGELTLFSFLVDKLGKRTNRDVTNDDFRSWLRTYPWLLVLDGLDEVPSSSNRAEVLQKIEDFWIEAAQVNADLLVVATTRPQDYHDDFSPQYYSHRWLVPLSPDRAVKYGGRLIELRHGENPDRKHQLIERLRDASSSEATARLMRTPLQVTIMATLVEQVGKPPQDRWRLFDEYYRAIYRRERERTQSELLGRHQSDIDAIHHRTGFELQIAAQAAGWTDAHLSAKQFEAIVLQRLEDGGHEGAKLAALKKEIVEAATFRLVFIVGLDVDSVGFEIRSLQEFMAAQALLAGETAMVQKRLRSIASIPSWRNVFIFAAGRCFADTESLIDTVLAICQELNDEGSVGQRIVRAGSQLALDLLEDAAVEAKPKHARLLARIALRLIDIPLGETHVRLASVCTAAVEAVFREELEERLKSGDVEEQLGAWKVVGNLMNRGLTWATTLAEHYWPVRPEGQALAITAVWGSGNTPWLVPRARRCLPRIESDALEPSVGRAVTDLAFRSDSWLSRMIFDRDVPAQRATLHLTNDTSGNSVLRLTYIGIEEFEKVDIPRWLDVDDQHPSWRPFSIALRHKGVLDAKRLAAFLAEIADSDSTMTWAWLFPWPIRATLSNATPDSIRRTVEKLRQGELGDRSEWLAAQRRWQFYGVGLGELRNLEFPWSREIASRGFPYHACGLSVTHGNATADFAQECARLFRDELDDRLKMSLGWWLTFTARPTLFDGGDFDPIPLDVVLEAASLGKRWLSCELASLALGHDTQTAVDFIERLGRCERLWAAQLPAETLNLACASLMRDPKRFGTAHIVSKGTNERNISSVRTQLSRLEMPESQPVHIRAAIAHLMALRIEAQPISPEDVAHIIANEFPEVAEQTATLIARSYQDADENLLAALSRSLTSKAWEARRAVWQALDNLLKSQAGYPLDRSILGFTAVPVN